MDWRLAFRRYGGWLILAIACAAYYPRFARDMSGGVARGGLSLLSHGAECLLGNEVLQACDLQFTYPPAFAFMMLPMLPFGGGVRMAVWYLIMIGATVGAYQLCEALARRLYPGTWSERELAWLRVVSIVLSIKFILAVLENQAFDTLVFLFILVGLWALMQRQEWLAGAAIALAAAIKGSPLIFVPYLVITLRWRACAAFAVVYLAASFLPDLFFTPKGGAHGYYVTWFREIAMGPLYDDANLTKYRFWVGENSNNHSLRALAYRMFPLGLGDPMFRPTLMAMYLPVVAALGYIIIKSMRSAEPARRVGLDGAAIVVAMLALSPMTSRSHYVALMLPYTVICAAVLTDARRRTLGIAVLAVSFLLATASGNDVVGGKFTDWAYARGAIVSGALVLLLYLVVLAREPESDTRQKASG